MVQNKKDKKKIIGGEKKFNFEYDQLPELVLFLACIGSHIAGSASYYYMYQYFSKKANFPFEFKNSRHTCSRHINASLNRIHNQVQTNVSEFQIMNIYCDTIPSVLVCLFLGPISDRIGRKPVINLALLGMIISNLSSLAVIHYDMNISWLYLSNALRSCIGGGDVGIRIAAMAYVIDISKDKKTLTVKLATLQCAELLGTTASSFIGGPFVQRAGFETPIIVGFTLYVVSAIYVVFFIRESLPTTNNLPLQAKEILYQPIHLVKVFTMKRDTKKELYLLFGTFILLSETNHAFGSGGSLFLLGQPFCLPPNLLGYLRGMKTTLHILGLLFSTKVLLTYVPALHICLFSMLATMLERTSMVVVETTLMIFVFGTIQFFSGWYSPIIRSFISKAVNENEQGSIISFLCVLVLILNSITKTVFLRLYAKLLHHGHVRWFFVLTSPMVMLATPLLCWFWKIKKKREEKEREMPLEKKVKELN